MSHSSFDRKIPKIRVLRVVNVQPQTGDTCEVQNFKFNYLETLFFRGSVTIPFKQINGCPNVHVSFKK